jgi:hypothetical protein
MCIINRADASESIHLHKRHAGGQRNSFYELQFPYHNREKETGQGNLLYALYSINLLHISRAVIKEFYSWHLCLFIRNMQTLHPPFCSDKLYANGV